MIATAVVVGFALGYLFPIVVFAAIPAVFAAVAPGADWSGFPQLPSVFSLLMGSATALFVARGLLAPSRREIAWGKGASGEQRTGRALEALARIGFTVLHDRRVAGSTATIDHLVITSSGVFLVDTKRYAGKLEIRDRGRAIWVGGRDRSRLLHHVGKQAGEVRHLLDQAGFETVPVTPVLCFVDTEMPLLASGRVGGVILCTPGTIRRRLARRGSTTLDAATRDALAQTLEEGSTPRRTV